MRRQAHSRDPRLRYLGSSPFDAAQLFAAWRAYCERQLKIPLSMQLAVCPDIDALRTFAWELTRKEGDYSIAQVRTVLDHLEGRLSQSSPRWIVSTAGLPSIRLNAGGYDNRADALAALDMGDRQADDWRRERIAQLRAEGATWPEIAARLDIGEATARRWCQSRSETPPNDQKHAQRRMDSEAA